MKQFFAIFRETFLSLRRDRVFLLAVVGGAMWLWFALIVSDWTFDDRRQLILEVGFLGLQIMGAVISIQWGTKLIQDAKRDGAIEIQMAAPVSRSVWLSAKLFGLTFSLILIGVSLGLFWNILLKTSDWGFLNPAENWAIVFQIVCWLVLAALSIFVSSFSTTGVALFVSLALWVVGVAAQYVTAAIPKDSSPAFRYFSEGLASVWNLSRFNILEQVHTQGSIATNEISQILLYGALLFFAFLTGGFIVFSRKDII